MGGSGVIKLTGCALPTGRASLHDKASLRIEQVRSEDQGWYECKVLMLDQQYDTFHNGSWVHLTVNGESQPAVQCWGVVVPHPAQRCSSVSAWNRGIGCSRRLRAWGTQLCWEHGVHEWTEVVMG